MMYFASNYSEYKSERVYSVFINLAVRGLIARVTVVCLLPRQMALNSTNTALIATKL